MTIRTLVTDAFREAGIIPVGGEVEAEEFEEGLRRLNALYSSMLGHELGEPVQTLSDCTTYTTVPLNVRVINPTAALTLDRQPQDGSRLYVVSDDGVDIDGNTRTIEGADTLVLTGTVNRQWFYRDDLADWVKINDLLADDNSPLPEEFDDLLITALAFRINPRYGATSSDSMLTVLQTMRSRVRARYRQDTEKSSEDGLVFLPSNRWKYLRSWNTFNRGY